MCVRVMLLLFREVLGRRVHQLPLLGAAVAVGVKHAASALSSSARPQIRHGVPGGRETRREGE